MDNETITQPTQEIVSKKTTIQKYNPNNQTVITGKQILLIDVSGSQNMYVGDKRKIEIIREVLIPCIDTEKYCFSEKVEKIKDIIPDPQSTTDMKVAFEYMKKVVNSATNLILISDGLPDNIDDAILAGKKLGIPINVLYIGIPGDKGEQFMHVLAKITGGSVITANTLRPDFQKQLSNGIEKMLFLE